MDTPVLWLLRIPVLFSILRAVLQLPWLLVLVVQAAGPRTRRPRNLPFYSSMLDGQGRVKFSSPSRLGLESGKINMCGKVVAVFMEASFLIQPWIASRTISDYCRLCFQARESNNFLPCKRAISAPYNSLLATLKLDMNPHSADALKRLEDAKETCLSAKNPNEHCYEKMQTTLRTTLQHFDQMLEDYKNKYSAIQNRITPMARM